jgi:hypothetical protein
MTTAQEMFDYMRSAEGGHFMVRDQEDSTFAVIYYDKKRTDMTRPEAGQYRSMIWNKVTNTGVPVAPQKGLSFNQAIDDGVKGFVAEEFVDGTMINIVWEAATGRWIPFTRTQIGAGSHFFGTRPFAELFWEAFHNCGITEEDLDTNVAYSWVLQHPEERIVAAPPYGIPRLFLINTTSCDIPKRLQPFLPALYPLKTLEDVKEFVASQGRRLGAQFQGVCLKTRDGKRYKLRTNEYDEARHLRGNQAKRSYLWLERWSENRLGQYLRLYPEEACDAETVVGQFKDATQELHRLYLQIYRQKALPLGQAPQKYRKLLWDLHQAGGGAYFPNVREFMNKQETARKLWVVNYEGRFGASVTTAPAVSTRADVGSAVAEPTVNTTMAPAMSVGADTTTVPEPTKTPAPPPMPSLFRSLSCTADVSVTPQVETPA